jgi:HEAT repeat protein
VASAMVGLLADPSILVRTSAESALTRVASKAPLEPPPALVEGLNAWPLKESRKAAAVALGSFKASPGRTVTALTRALGDKEPEVRSDAAVALGKFVPDAAPALPDLIKNLVDPFVPPPPSQASALMPSVRPAGALGGGGGNEPASPTSPTSPTDPAVQAALAIGRIVQGQVEKGAAPAADALEALTRALHSDREALRDAAEEALRRIGKGALSVIPTLIQDLVDSTPKTGAGLGPTAATLLGDIAPGTERAVEAVIALTSAVDANDPAIRIAAIKGLARFGPLASAALPRLREVAGDQGMATDVTTVVQTTIDRIEGKAPPESPRRKGQGRRGRR